MITKVSDTKVAEADTTRPEHHVVYLRVVSCGAPGCSDRAGNWMRCATCKSLVARCGLHNRHLPQTTKEHCHG